MDEKPQRYDLQIAEAIENSAYFVQQASTYPLALNGSSVHTNCNVPNHSILNILTVYCNDADHRIVSSFRILVKNRVVGVGGAVNLGVAGVGFKSHDLLFKVFFEVELARRNNVAGGDGAI